MLSFAGIGFGICLVSTFVGSYYNTIIAWALYYLVMSFRSPLLYARCDNAWNTLQCVEPRHTENRTNESVSAATEFFKSVLEHGRCRCRCCCVVVLVVVVVAGVAVFVLLILLVLLRRNTLLRAEVSSSLNEVETH